MFVCLRWAQNVSTQPFLSCMKIFASGSCAWSAGMQCMLIRFSFLPNTSVRNIGSAFAKSLIPELKTLKRFSRPLTLMLCRKPRSRIGVTASNVIASQWSVRYASGWPLYKPKQGTGKGLTKNVGRSSCNNPGNCLQTGKMYRISAFHSNNRCACRECQQNSSHAGRAAEATPWKSIGTCWTTQTMKQTSWRPFLLMMGYGFVISAHCFWWSYMKMKIGWVHTAYLHSRQLGANTACQCRGFYVCARSVVLPLRQRILLTGHY